MSGASTSHAVDVAPPISTTDGSSTSPTRDSTSDQPAASTTTTPRRRQRQPPSKGLIRPAKLTGRYSRRQKEVESGKEQADALLGEAEVDPAAEEDEQQCVGILFLAHDGVTNPSLWEKWRDSDPVRESKEGWQGLRVRLL